MQKLTVAEYCRKFGTADSTVRHRVKTGKLQSERIDELLYIVTDGDDIATSSDEQSQAVVEAQREEIQFLRQQLQETCTEKDKQIEELHQLVAMTQKSVNQLTAQNQLLLEDTQQQPSFWQRIKSHFAEA